MRATAGLLSDTTGIIDSHALMRGLQRDAERGCRVVVAQSARCHSHRRGASLCGSANPTYCAVRWSTRQGSGPSRSPNGCRDSIPHVPRLFLAKGNYFTVTGNRLLAPDLPGAPAGGSGRSPHAGSAGNHTVRPRCRMDRAGGLHRRPDARPGVLHRDPSLLAGPARRALRPDYAGIRPKLQGRGMPREIS